MTADQSTFDTADVGAEAQISYTDISNTKISVPDGYLHNKTLLRSAGTADSRVKIADSTIRFVNLEIGPGSLLEKARFDESSSATSFKFGNKVTIKNFAFLRYDRYKPEVKYPTTFKVGDNTFIENGMLEPVDQCLPIFRPSLISFTIGKENEATHYDFGGKVTQLTAEGFSCSARM